MLDTNWHCTTGQSGRCWAVSVGLYSFLSKMSTPLKVWQCIYSISPCPQKMMVCCFGLCLCVLFYLFIYFTTGTAHNTRGTPDPGAGKRKKKKKKENLAWKSYKKKTSAWCRATGGGPSRRTGAVALQAAGVKYLCVTDVFIAFSAPQPAGRGFGSSPRLIKSLHATHPFQPHPLSISIQRKQIRGGGWHLDIFGLRPASLIGPCNCRAVLFCVMLFFYEILIFLKKVTWVEPCCCW